MFASSEDKIRGGKIVEQVDVRDEAAAGVGALNQIMAQDVVFGERISHGLLKGVYVVNALARERADAEKVLVNIGDGRRIGIEAGGAAEDAREPRLANSCHRQADARLQDPVTGDDAPPFRVKDRPIQRMGQGRN